MNRALLAVSATAIIGILSGCAGTDAWQFSSQPGVAVTVAPSSGDAFSGTLVGYEQGVFFVDRAIPKSEHLEVVRRDGRDIAYVGGVVVGTAVEVRDFDIVVRQTLDRRDLGETRVATRAYFGWGTAVAAALSFFLVRLLEDT